MNKNTKMLGGNEEMNEILYTYNVEEGSKQLLINLVSEEKIHKYLTLIKEHHYETYTHSLQVALLCIELGFINQFDQKNRECLGYAGLLHDFGKLGISKEILSKESQLGCLEKGIVRKHPRLSFAGLEGLNNGTITSVIVSHHEYQNNPYPRNGIDRRIHNRGYYRRAGNTIIRSLAQILAVSDMYDSLRSKRSYKNPMNKEMAMSIMLEQYKGDPRYVYQIISR